MLWDTTGLEYPYKSRELITAWQVHNYEFRDQAGYSIDRPFWVPSGATHKKEDRGFIWMGLEAACC